MRGAVLAGLLLAGCFAEERLADPTKIKTFAFGGDDRSCATHVWQRDGLGPGCSNVRELYGLAVFRCGFRYQISATICEAAGVVVEQECGPFQHEAVRVRVFCPAEYVTLESTCRVPIDGSAGAWWVFPCKPPSNAITR